MNEYPLLTKLAMTLLMSLLLLIPLKMIESKIGERQALQHSVQDEIARGTAGAQTLNGPYLVVKYRVRSRKVIKDKDGSEKTVTSESGILEKLIPARNLRVSGNAGVETLNRGIYRAQLYTLDSTLSGDFAVPANFGINRPPQDLILDGLYFTLGISDARGIQNIPEATINGSKLEFQPGATSPVSGNGIHIRLAMPEAGQAHAYSFSFPLSLRGMNTLALIPAGDNTEVKLQSPWPHPSFGGNFLPGHRHVDSSGFSAQWNISNLARNSVAGAETAEPLLGAPGRPAMENFSVAFIDPVNIYLLSERAVKYGVLFVVLVFTAFFMFEVMRSLRIHPLQYLLVGLAMAMFFLLIISLSEHIPFLAAYGISGAACVTLIGAYLAGVLRNRRLGTGFAAAIALLYAVLYGVLKSEDNALLMGTAILFTALAAVMLLTRHMDWYRLSPAAPAQPGGKD